MRKPSNLLERISRIVTLTAFGIAAFGVVVAPVLALSWANLPFPGFVLDRTLVATDQGGPGWTGREAGIGFGQQITRIGGSGVANDAEYNQALNALDIGDKVAISTRTREGIAKFYPSVVLTEFPTADLFRLFWMPYLMGLAYLAIGAWIYRARGATPPGRALAFFCFAAAVAQGLYFDLYSTHLGTPVWAVAMAALGGALLSLAMRFPQQAQVVDRHPGLLAAPYIISIGIGFWAVFSLYDAAHPWNYLVARDVSYRYTGIGGVLFLGTMAYRAFQGREATVRRQARIVLFGGAIAFVPIIIWIMAPLAGLRLRFEPVLYMPWLIIFPFSVAIAIFRYRLLEMDAIVNRTIMWAMLTAVLYAVISVSVSLLQRLFQAVTGEKSDVAIVLSSLILVSVFTLIKTRLQSLVDRTFKDSPEHIRALSEFGGAVRSYVQMTDPDLMTGRLLHEAATGMGAQSGAIRLATNGTSHLETVQTYGDWRGEAWIAAPLEHAGKRLGLLLLGPRQGHKPYTREEFAALQEAATEVAHALAVGRS